MTENQKQLKILIRHKPKEHEVYEGYYNRAVEQNTGKLIDNIPFKTKLEYVGFVRGRSALNIQWKDLNTNIIYYSGMTLLDEALKNKRIKEGGIIEGEFWFKKQGTSILLTGCI